MLDTERSWRCRHSAPAEPGVKAKKSWSARAEGDCFLAWKSPAAPGVLADAPAKEKADDGACFAQ